MIPGVAHAEVRPKQQALQRFAECVFPRQAEARTFRARVRGGEMSCTYGTTPERGLLGG